jgi:hypothetical protein
MKTHWELKLVIVYDPKAKQHFANNYADSHWESFQGDRYAYGKCEDIHSKLRFVVGSYSFAYQLIKD